MAYSQPGFLDRAENIVIAAEAKWADIVEGHPRMGERVVEGLVATAFGLGVVSIEHAAWNLPKKDKLARACLHGMAAGLTWLGICATSSVKELEVVEYVPYSETAPSLA